MFCCGPLPVLRRGGRHNPGSGIGRFFSFDLLRAVFYFSLQLQYITLHSRKINVSWKNNFEKYFRKTCRTRSWGGSPEFLWIQRGLEGKILLLFSVRLLPGRGGGRKEASCFLPLPGHFHCPHSIFYLFFLLLFFVFRKFGAPDDFFQSVSLGTNMRSPE